MRTKLIEKYRENPRIFKMTIAFTLVIWFGAGVAAYKSIQDAALREELAVQGIVTNASVISLDPHNHCTCTYSFGVGGNTYTHTGGCCDKPLGSRVEVRYLARDPSKSAYFRSNELSRAKEGLWSNLRILYFLYPIALVLAIPFFIYVVLESEDRRRKKGSL